MLERLGTVIYWASTLIALGIAGSAGYGYFLGSGGNPFAQLYAGVIAALIWLAGVGLRYVFRG